MRYILAITCIVFALNIAGCSGGGVMPDIPGGMSNPSAGAPTETARIPDGYPDATRLPLGFYSITADPDFGTLDIVPIRTAEQHLNAIPFLETGTDQLVQLAGPPQFSNGGKQLDVDIRITHPHSDPLFTGFDVHGVLITEGSPGEWNDPDLVIAGSNETRLMNPDGMTRWWNPAEFTNSGLYGYTQGEMGNVIPAGQASTLNGYKTFADGLGPISEMSDIDPALRGMLSVGSDCVRHYTISLEGGLKFNYAVDASWAFPTSTPPVPPVDFPAKANMPEPYWIDVVDTINTLWWEDGVGYGGNVFYNITIHDWQGADTIGTPRIEIPGLGVNSELTHPIESGADYEQYAYSIVLPDLQSGDSLDVLISVDSLQGSYQPVVTGVDKTLRAYQLHFTEVADEDPGINLNPVSVMHPTTPTNIFVGGSVAFDASWSYDPDGYVVDYLWDFDGDGNYGDTYEAGTDIAPEKFYYTNSVFDVDLRVVDNEGADDYLDEKIPVTVLNSPPIAVAEFTTPPPYYESFEYTISAVNSIDIDGTIEIYEWDVDYNGITFNPTMAGEEIQAQWDSEGVYSIMLRVVDDDAAEDFLDEALEISVYSVPEITGIKVTYEDSQKVTWTISGNGFLDSEGEIITDLPDGWNAEIITWGDDEIVCKYNPYSMDVTASVLAGGTESNEWFIPESDGILVIYNINSTISGQIKDYYVSPTTGRGIPPEHVMGLDASDTETVNRDTYNALRNDIELWLTSNEVRYEVKYIVTCKGVPLRIAKVNGSGTTADFACFDSELCLLYETYDILGRKTNAYYSYITPRVFHPGKYSYGGLTVRYIVTRLTGYTYEEVTGMIDRCLDPYTGDDVWHILDGDPDIWYDYMDQAAPLMVAAGLNTYYDDTNTFVTAATIADLGISDHVMTYTGHGIHHSPNPGTYYIINDLQFTYPNGALFNSYESFNGITFTWETHSGHGMVGDFIRMGGCGGIGHVYEPYSDGVGDERCIARWYERGYNLAEAQYLGLRYVSWTEVVAGEPLCRIAPWEG